MKITVHRGVKRLTQEMTFVKYIVSARHVVGIQ